MDDFSVLEKVGLKEVSNKTHIEVKHLEYMVSSQFDKLNKVSTVGFVKILSREYGLDLTDWLNEAQKFWSENRVIDSGPKIFVVQKRKTFLKTLIAILFISILVVILYGAYIFLNKKLDFFQNPLVKTDMNYTYEETPVVNEAKETLDKNITQNDENSTIVADENQSSMPETDKTESVVKTDEVNNSSVVLPIDSNITDLNVSALENNTTDKEAVEKTDDYISPNTKLWVGVIYLDNFKRKSFLGEENVTLDASRDQLITTGHGNFILHFNSEIKKFPPQKPVRLLLKDGKISVITDSEFKELNKGSIW